MAKITLQGTKGIYIFNPEDRTNCWEGGMGRVYKGVGKIIDNGKEIERDVAIKVLFRELTNNANNVERFKIESTVKIKHKNLVEMFDFVEEDGKFHIISEFLEGEVLSDKIDNLSKKGETFSIDDAKKIILAVSEGLEELHKNNIIHRDIKPSNIMLLYDGNIKLFDYGVIKKNDDVIKKLTRDGSFVGSIQYASPEQIRNIDKASINESTDVYSLGITLYELITGKVPFDGSSEYEIMDKHTKEIVPLHSKLNKGYYNLIANATAKDQKYRYKSITQFRDDLVKLPNGNVSLIRNEWWQTKNFKIASTLIIILLIGAGIFYYYTQKQNKENYIQNVSKADLFYSIAKYDSAKIYYDRATQYVETDSIKHKSAILNAFIPAMQAFYNAKYKDAFEKLKIAADMGLGDAYYYLGELTYNGLGTIKDYKKGSEFTNKAIDKGFKMAYWRKANAYESGKGVIKDKDKADKYYLEAIEGMKKLAEGGDPEALGNLGSMYSSGSGVAKNEKIGFEYYLKSANTGYAFIMSNLGDMYQYGFGVKADADEAIIWYTKSSNLGHPTAQLSLGNLYLLGESVEKNISKGLELINKAADQNYPAALNRLGVLYYRGEIVSIDFRKALEYTKKAVEYDNDNVTAVENLAYYYENGVGTEKNYSVAKEYYLRAVNNDSTRTENFIKVGLLYLAGGFGLTKSDSEFIRYCELAEKAGNLVARQILGKYYLDKGYKAYNEQNYSLARSYFNLAITKDNTTAQNNLRFMNEKGL